VHSKADSGGIEVRLSLQASPAGVTAADERNRQATVASLKPILQPRAVAVVGASRQDSNLGRRVFVMWPRAEAGLPVNPAVAELGGLCYASARDLPSGVVYGHRRPVRIVIAAVDDCAAARVRASSSSVGFAESDARGRNWKRAGGAVRPQDAHGEAELRGHQHCSALRFNASFAERTASDRIALASQAEPASLC
jgi:predicted CoA-binding protein